MIPEGKYLLTHVGFSRDEKPVLTLQQNNQVFHLEPLGHTLTLSFDTSARRCVGWHDITKGESFVCPDALVVDEKFEQCAACQKRTGFNPAFYNATSVSPQQEQRNLEPHFLYLAHFASGVIKVGISHAARGRARLLEQGARTAVILDTFPTAHIARQYEAKIAAIPGIAETIQIKRKLELIKQPYDEKQAIEELIEARERIAATLSASFSSSQPMTLHHHFFVNSLPRLESAINVVKQDALSGKIIGMLGGFLFSRHQDSDIFIPVKKYTGYGVTISHIEAPITLPSQQISLF
jgi:hypothetical protein